MDLSVQMVPEALTATIESNVLTAGTQRGNTLRALEVHRLCDLLLNSAPLCSLVFGMILL
jgi:hypothetical protein